MVEFLTAKDAKDTKKRRVGMAWGSGSQWNFLGWQLVGIGLFCGHGTVQ
jgi:hypothetical protein